MPVVRVRFKAANGRVREGNVLVDSGAGTTVIRKEFAKALGLQGRTEHIDLAVVGGERITYLRIVATKVLDFSPKQRRRVHH